MLSYGGVPLTLPTPRQVEWLSSTFTLRRLFEFSRLTWPGPRTPWLTWGGATPDEPLKLGCLNWPKGASRFATFFAVVSDSVLAATRVAGAPSTQQVLTMTWGDEAHGTTPGTISTPMWMLPALPLTQIGGEPGHSLLTLVDDRYWWWFRSEGVLAVTDGVTTWADLYAFLAAALGVTFGHDAIDAAYLTPTTLWSSNYEYLPLLLDAVAFNVGQRIVRRLNGDVYGRAVSNGAADVADNLALPAARSLLGGGAFLPSDVLASIPSQVVVSFPTGDVTAPHAVTKTTGGTAVATKQFHSGFAFDGTNGAALDALAALIGLDFGYASSQVGDWKFAGIVPWVPDVNHDAVEWVYAGEGGPLGAGEVSTRIIPAPWNDLSDGFLGGGGSGLEVVNADATEETNPASVITLNNDQGTKAFGRLHTTDLGGGVALLDWQGLRLYKSGTGYVGPEPDIEFIAGAGITIVIADDGADQRVQATISATGSTGAVEVINQDATQDTNPASVITCDNDMGTAAFGRIYTTALGGGNALIDWQGLRLYKSGTGYVGPEPDIEFIAGTNVTISIADDAADARVQVTINATGAAGTLTFAEVALASSYTLTGTFANVGFPALLLPTAGKTYKLYADVSASLQTSIAQGYVKIELWDATAGARITNSTRAVLTCAAAAFLTEEGGHVEVDYVAPAVNTSIQLFAKYITTGVFAAGQIIGADTNLGESVLGYVQLSY